MKKLVFGITAGYIVLQVNNIRLWKKYCNEDPSSVKAEQYELKTLATRSRILMVSVSLENYLKKTIETLEFNSVVKGSGLK